MGMGRKYNRNMTFEITQNGITKTEKTEHNDIRWITVDEIGLYDFCPADEAILRAIKAAGRKEGMHAT